MADFTIRIELRGDPSYAQYEKLHGLMSGLGFARTVSGVTSSGTPSIFNLPHATYYGPSSSSCSAVRDLVRSRVHAEIQPGVIIFVAETNTWGIG
jgi:hypothetical protein